MLKIDMMDSISIPIILTHWPLRDVAVELVIGNFQSHIKAT